MVRDIFRDRLTQGEFEVIVTEYGDAQTSTRGVCADRQLVSATSNRVGDNGCGGSEIDRLVTGEPVGSQPGETEIPLPPTAVCPIVATVVDADLTVSNHGISRRVNTSRVVSALRSTGNQGS